MNFVNKRLLVKARDVVNICHRLTIFPGIMLVLGAVGGALSHLDAQGSHSFSAQDVLISQDTPAKAVTISLKNSSIEAVLKAISDASKLRLFYTSNYPELNRKIDFSVTNEPPISAINKALIGTGLIASQTADGSGIMIKARPNDTTVDARLSEKKGVVVGVVQDSASKSAISGATVQVVGHNVFATSDNTGKFVLRNISVGQHTLSIKILGYRTQSITVDIKEDKAENIVVLLRPAPTSLTEVVTTASGQQRRVEVAHDIAKIDAEVIMKRSPVRSVSDLLEAAQVPGVLIQRASGDPGSPTKIRIRGIGSISQSNDPVVIVDGVWIDASLGTPSRIDDIDPATIETIEVVRGPSAATLYGQDASNGVIVITTKKGTVGPTRWNFSYDRDWGKITAKHPILYSGFGHDPLNGNRRVCDNLSILDGYCIQDTVYRFDPNNALVLRDGVETNNRFMLQMDGGVPSARYAITFGSQDQIGVQRSAEIDKIRARILGYVSDPSLEKPSSLDRKNFGSNLTLLPRPSLTLGFTLNGTRTKVSKGAYEYLYSPKDASPAALKYSLDTVDFVGRSNTIKRHRNPVISNAVVLGATSMWRPNNYLNFNTTLGVERVTTEDDKITGITECGYSSQCREVPGTRVLIQESKSIYTLRMNLATTPPFRKFEKFLELRPSIGGDLRRNDESRTNIRQIEIAPGETAFIGGVNGSMEYNVTPNATAGVYVNTTIGLLRRIYFDVGIRHDVGSAIPSSSNTNYPKLGGSWLVSDESFWPANNLINLLRVRAAIGHSAVQPSIEDIKGRYISGYFFQNGQYIRSIDFAGTGNPYLSPERATEVEVGLDADLLYDRLNLIMTLARSENKNSLVSRTLPLSTGLSGTESTLTRKENIARVQNFNLEIAANVRAMETSDHLIVFNYSLTVSDNKVSRLGNGITPFSATGSGRIAQGYPIGATWSRIALGYMDVNTDGILSRDEVVLSDSVAYIGWSQPRYRASYGVSWNIKNQVTLDSRFAYQSKYAQSLQVLNSYGSEDKNSPLSDQATGMVNFLSGTKSVSDLRWNSASISYRVPDHLVQKIKGRSLNLSLQVSNLALWTNYSGRDPGVNSSIFEGETLTDDGSTNPRPRLFVFSVKWGF